MDAVLPSVGLKSFARILQCLAKVGEDLYIQPRANKLLFATVNASRSACAHFTLHTGFFESYTAQARVLDAAGNEAGASSCHVLLKPLLNVFRAKNGMDNVESCRIKLQCAGDRDRLVIQLHCKYGILKTHKLHFELCDPLAAIYSKASAPHHWTISSKLAHDWLAHFHARLEEITMRCAHGEMALKSFTETVLADEEDQMGSRSLQTELTVDVEDFDAFTVAAPTEVTFDLRNLKAILSFADAMGQPVSAFFDQAGRPVVLTVTQTPDLYALDLVVATTAPFEDDPAPEPSTANSFNNHNQNNNDRSQPQPLRTAAAQHPRTPAPAAPPPRSHVRGALESAAAAASSSSAASPTSPSAVGRPMDETNNDHATNNGNNADQPNEYYDEYATLLLENDDEDHSLDGNDNDDDDNDDDDGDDDEMLPPSPPQRTAPLPLRQLPSDAAGVGPTTASLSMGVTHVSDSAPGEDAAAPFFTDGDDYDMAWFNDAGVEDDEGDGEVLEPTPKKPRYLR
ncbi:Cell cycle checkpoint control protein rad9b [Geranomyces variabilis]|uniref:Cell cycle checkpoint control protein RAD9A n=1 Tax=Geranomyces variabilis TaxID=109894 RepID=A0AAD5TD11_9FUNG|nr:Cell cycle checkpoint control protein rad9b [Geranomyces variabilis]